MGLDVYFRKYEHYNQIEQIENIMSQCNSLIEEYKKNRTPINNLQKSIKQLERDLKQAATQDGIAYFRKAYFILSYFGYTIDCSDMTLTKQDVQNLINSLKEVLTLNKQEYSVNEYENKVYTILKCNEDNFWYNYTPNELPLDMYETAIDHLEHALEEIEDDEPIILYAWW